MYREREREIMIIIAIITYFLLVLVSVVSVYVLCEESTRLAETRLAQNSLIALNKPKSPLNGF